MEGTSGREAYVPRSLCVQGTHSSACARARHDHEEELAKLEGLIAAYERLAEAKKAAGAPWALRARGLKPGRADGIRHSRHGMAWQAGQGRTRQIRTSCSLRCAGSGSSENTECSKHEARNPACA